MLGIDPYQFIPSGAREVISLPLARPRLQDGTRSEPGRSEIVPSRYVKEPDIARQLAEETNSASDEDRRDILSTM
jgi:hypothetical protein